MVVVVVVVEERTQWNKHKMIKLEIRVKDKTNQWSFFIADIARVEIPVR